MKKKLAVYVGINLLIWIMLLFVPTVSSYIYEKINRNPWNLQISRPFLCFCGAMFF